MTFCLTCAEPVKPVVEVPEGKRDFPVGDGSPVTMNIGDNVTAASDTTITIRCPVSGTPTPSVTWEKDEVEIVEGEKFSITSNNSLVIKEATVEDSAKYTCRLRSIVGTDSGLSNVKILGEYYQVVAV